MRGIFVRPVLLGRVCGVSIVGFVIGVLPDMISISPFLRQGVNCSHCPWVNNCVGVRTHRSFVTYVTLLEIGIPMFVYLAYLCNLPLEKLLMVKLSRQYPYLQTQNVKFYQWISVNLLLPMHILQS